MTPAKPKFCGAATLFVVQDVLKSVAHYTDVLGFRLGFVYGDPVFYAGVERDEVAIHLQAAHKSERQAGHGAVNVFVTEVDALYEALKMRGARLVNAPKNYDYGMRNFDVDDIDGNRLCFGMGTEDASS